MTRAEIDAIIRRALVEEFELEPEALVPEAHIKTNLGLDSLDIVDMVIILEAAFGFTIKNKSALLKIQTLGDISDFIENIANNPQQNEVEPTV